MNEYNRLLQLLEEKKEAFTQYANATQQMEDCPEDALEGCMERRIELVEQINRLDVQIRSACEGHAVAPDVLWDIIKNKCNRGDLPLETTALFDLGQSIFQVISTITQMEISVRNRLEQLQQKAQQQIESTNNTSKIVKYFSTMPGSQPSIDFLQRKYDKI